MWSKKYCDTTNSNLGELMAEFIVHVKFQFIPANILMKDVYPLGIVPPHIIMTALAFQVIHLKIVLFNSGSERNFQKYCIIISASRENKANPLYFS